MKFLQNLKLRFQKEDMEQGYMLLRKENLVTDFRICAIFLILLNSVSLIFTLPNKNWEEAYYAGGTVVIMTFLLCIQRFLKNYIQFVTFLMIVGYNVARLLQTDVFVGYSKPSRLFFAGYGLAIIQDMLLLRLANISYKIYGVIIALVLRFAYIYGSLDPAGFNTSVLIKHIIIDAFSIFTIYTYEVIFRKIYQRFVQKNEELLKFKELLAEYLPQSLIVVTYGSNDVLFSNKTFQSTFGYPNTQEESSVTPPDMASLKPSLKSLVVDQTTIREAGTSNSVLVSLTDVEPFMTLKEVLEGLSSNGYLNHKAVSLAASMTRKDKRVLFEVTITKVRWDLEDAIAVLFNDITYQENLISLKLANVNKDKVIATVSHELRTPLNGIIGILDITEKKVENSEVLEYLSLCKDNALLLLSLVNSILDLQQISAGKLKLDPVKINLRKVLNSITQLFYFQCRQKNIYLECAVNSDIPVNICTDENRLKQVLINLVGNAIKFTSKGGIKIEVIQHPENLDSLQISVIDTGIGIRKEDQKHLFKMYSKIDNGESVNKNGVGLGLTISNALVVLLNGGYDDKGISVESEYGTGCTFYFDIQRNLKAQNKLQTFESYRKILMTNDDNDNTRSILVTHQDQKTKGNEEDFENECQDEYEEFFEPHSPRLKISSHTFPLKINCSKILQNDRCEDGLLRKELPGMEDHLVNEKRDPEGVFNENRLKHKGSILIVDDNPFNLLVAKSVIQEFGYVIQTALGGQEAIEKVKKNLSEGTKIKAIFMDCQMPIMDGFETTKALKALMANDQIPKIPIFGWTANNAEEDIKRCYDAGMVGYLPKPASKLDISKALSKIQN